MRAGEMPNLWLSVYQYGAAFSLPGLQTLWVLLVPAVRSWYSVCVCVCPCSLWLKGSSQSIRKWQVAMGRKAKAISDLGTVGSKGDEYRATMCVGGNKAIAYFNGPCRVRQSDAWRDLEAMRAASSRTALPEVVRQLKEAAAQERQASMAALFPEPSRQDEDTQLFGRGGGVPEPAASAAPGSRSSVLTRDASDPEALVRKASYMDGSAKRGPRSRPRRQGKASYKKGKKKEAAEPAKKRRKRPTGRAQKMPRLDITLPQSLETLRSKIWRRKTSEEVTGSYLYRHHNDSLKNCFEGLSRFLQENHKEAYRKYSELPCNAQGWAQKRDFLAFVLLDPIKGPEQIMNV